MPEVEVRATNEVLVCRQTEFCFSAKGDTTFSGSCGPFQSIHFSCLHIFLVVAQTGTGQRRLDT